MLRALNADILHYVLSKNAFQLNLDFLGSLSRTSLACYGVYIGHARFLSNAGDQLVSVYRSAYGAINAEPATICFARILCLGTDELWRSGGDRLGLSLSLTSIVTTSFNSF
jgi:hypothetical protein